MAKISMGPNNTINRPLITHTNQIGKAEYAALGGSAENSELRLGGQVYAGPLGPDDNVEIVQQANQKQAS